MGEEFLRRLKELAEKVHVIAPEHGRSTYGDVERRIPPWRIYSEEDARKGLDCAEEATKWLTVLSKLGTADTHLAV